MAKVAPATQEFFFVHSENKCGEHIAAKGATEAIANSVMLGENREREREHRIKNNKNRK